MAVGVIIGLIKNQWSIANPQILCLGCPGQIKITLVFSESVVILLKDLAKMLRHMKVHFFQISINLWSPISLHAQVFFMHCK